MTFYWLIMMTIILSFSTNSFLFLWICLEINMMSFIPLMNSKTLISSNSMMLYFLIQASASSIFMMSISMTSFSWNPQIYFTMLTMILMLVKMAAIPFHFWFPQVSEGLTYSSFFILSSLQKIIPLYIMSILKEKMLIPFIIMTSMGGSILGFNQFSIRKILAFSSITHLAWMMTLIYINSNIWILYMMVYSTILFLMINFFDKNNLNSMNSSKLLLKEEKIFMIIMLMSLGGLPPMIGFIMKWISLNIIITHMKLLTIPLIISSIINLYFYTRLTFSLLLKNFQLNKWSKKLKTSLMMMIIPNFMMILIMIPMM
uniref:NADH dehydrogenase subunit 2 n=1 Tax=Alectorobius rudis TaxID=2058922 RepID=UPI0022375B0D|nr:NADH dehydrogenase subunit 2 [Alectorobius rudis]UYB78613.1 NADH dehydrogenase subunit 2 [Alectorobius rudis]